MGGCLSTLRVGGRLSTLRVGGRLSTRYLPLLALGVAAVGSSCIASNHPLASSGTAQFLVDASPIYAADVLDETGAPVLPRQSPFERDVQIKMTTAGAPDHGAYVDVQLSPPGVLQLIPTDDSCEEMPGVFRCTAESDGFANFKVRSASDWSGLATLSLIGRVETKAVVVNPAGLPESATNFTMIIEGIDNGRVPARYNALECTLDPSPDQTFEKWPEGATRVREAEVRATAPAGQPSVVEHAPVIIQTLHPEAFVTLDPNCGPPRNSLLRVQLDQLGQSPRFYFCFSDIGGNNVQLSFNSGSKLGTSRFLTVEPEPRLLRVITTKTTVQPFAGNVDVVSLSAFDADLGKVPITVDVTSTDPTIFFPNQPTAVLPSEGEDAKLVFVTPLAAGEATIQVTPELHSSPVCSSDVITVLP